MPAPLLAQMAVKPRFSLVGCLFEGARCHASISCGAVGATSGAGHYTDVLHADLSQRSGGGVVSWLAHRCGNELVTRWKQPCHAGNSQFDWCGGIVFSYESFELLPAYLLLVLIGVLTGGFLSFPSMRCYKAD